MKKFYKKMKKEKGDIALIAVFASLVCVLLMAFVIDGGYLYWKTAKLQNAVDASVVAVAHNIGSDDDAMRVSAEKYLKENGFDVKAYGAPTKSTNSDSDAIYTYGDPSSKNPYAVVEIGMKGTLTEELAASNEDAYISAGYVRLAAQLKNSSGLFKNLSGFDSLSLSADGYAKCEMQYVKMPKALNYTIFGNSDKQANKFSDMTVQINGRTNNVDAVVNVFQDLINGINEKIVQPIIGIFGGKENYNKLINVSLSHAITNGDVHSNSDINVGVANLQASRTKDQDYSGDLDECTCQTKCSKDYKNSYCSVCVSDYTKCEGDNPTPDDYNQVNYTAVGRIYFSKADQINSTLLNRIFDLDATKNTNVYVQNQQYLEITSVALRVIDHIDFSTVSNIETLKSAYTTEANSYLDTLVSLPAMQRQAVLDQVNNLSYWGKGKFALNGQKSIVYDVTVGMANQTLHEFENGKTISDFLDDVLSAGIDDIATSESKSSYDSQSMTETYTVEFTYNDNTPKGNVTVTNVNVTNRNIDYMRKNATVTNKARAGYNFALVRTFREYSDYIQIPNMKPYFVRTINRSVKNATTSKTSSEDSDTPDAVSIKGATKNTQNELLELINKEKTLLKQKGINTGTDAADPESYRDDTYETSESVRNVNTTPLFRHKLTSKVDNSNENPDVNDLQLDTYGNSDDGHLNFLGESVFKDGYLKEPSQFIKGYYGNNHMKFGLLGITRYAAANLVDNAGTDGVAAAKKNIIKTKSYSGVNETVGTTGFNETVHSGKTVYEAPLEKNIFLLSSALQGGTSVPASTLNSKINTSLSDFDEYTTSQIDNSPDLEIAAPDKRTNITFNRKIKVGTASYVMKELMAPVVTDKNAAQALSIFLSQQPKMTASSFGGSGTKKVTDENVSSYQYQLKNGYRYNRVNQIHSGFLGGNKAGFKVVKNASVRVDGVYLANEGLVGYRGVQLEENAKLLIKNDNYPNGDYHQPSGDVKYVFYNADNNGPLILDTGSSMYVEGNAYVKVTEQDNCITIGQNATLYVNGDLKVENKPIKMSSGAKLIVTGKLTCYKLDADADNTVVYAGSIDNTDNSGAIATNIYVAGNASLRGITLRSGGNLLVGGNLNFNNRDIVINNNTNFEVIGDVTNTGNATMPTSNYGFYVGGTTFNKFDFGTSAYTIPSDVSIGVANFKCGNLTVNGELYLPSNTTYAGNSGELTNNGVCRIDKSISGTNLSNGQNAQLKVLGDINYKWIENKGTIICTGSINATGGTINQNSNGNAYLGANSIKADNLYVSSGYVFVEPGDVTIINQIQTSVCKLYVKNGTINAKSLIAYDNSNVYAGNNLFVEELTLNTANLQVVNALSAGNISVPSYSNPKVHYGSISAAKIIVRAGSKVWISGGNLGSASITNHGTLYIKSSTSLQYIENDGTIICKGNLNLTSTNITANHTTESLTNMGNLYVSGSITAVGTLGFYGGDVYIGDDVKGATSTTNSIVLDIDGDKNNIYIGGWVASNANGVIKSRETATNSLLSIFGGDGIGTHQTSIDSSTVKSIENYGYGCKMYLGTGAVTKTYMASRKVTIASNLVNYGQLYVYGNLELQGTSTLSGTETSDSKTVVAFGVTSEDNDITVGTSQSSKHILRAYQTINTNDLTVSGASEVYGVDALNITNKTFKVLDDGVVFCGPSTTTTNYAVIKLQSRDDVTYSGVVYYPGANYSYTLDCPSSFKGGGFVTDASVTFKTSISMNAHPTTGKPSYIYVGGETKFQNSGDNITNFAGELYLMDSIYLSTTAPQFQFKSGCVNYISPIYINNEKIDAMTFKGPFNCGGINYIENSVIANTDFANPNKGESMMAGKRWTSIYIQDGETHIAGSLRVPNIARGTRVDTTATLTCESFSTKSAIHNYGNFIIVGDLTYTCNDVEYSDIDTSVSMTEGACIQNGRADGLNQGVFYVGGTTPVEFKGYIRNNAMFYFRPKLTITGNYIPADSLYFRNIGEDTDIKKYYSRTKSKQTAYAPRFGIVGGRNSMMCCGSDIVMATGVYTLKNGIVSCEGNLEYGMAILNGGVVFAKGQIKYSPIAYGYYHIEAILNETYGRNGAYSIINGYIDSAEKQNTNAVLYSGGSLQVGASENAEEKKLAGSVVNFGRMYINGDLTVYSNAKLAINIISFNAQQDSKTFINGNCWNSGGFVTMRNTIFMCTGDLFAKRCANLGADTKVEDKDDLGYASYTYVGGNMVTSAEGAKSSGNIGIDGHTWNYFIVYSNANVYIGGSFFTYSIFVPKKNVTFVVDGTTNDKASSTAIKFRTLVGDAIRDLKMELRGLDSSKVRFVVVGDDTINGFEDNGNKGIMYTFVVHGSVYVENTFRTRDMSKWYIYGDFVNPSNNTSRNIEIGKSLSGTDDTWAKAAPFRTDKDITSRYDYANGTYMYVQGSFETRGRLNTYAGAVVKVGGNVYARNKIQLSHHSAILAGGKVKCTRVLVFNGFIDGKQYSRLFAGGGIDADGYISMAEHSIMYSGKKISATTSLEAKSYSTVYAHGDIQAQLSTMKIRDNSTVFCAGSMTALRYIELGKFDEKYTNSIEKSECTCLKQCTSGSVDSDCALCSDDYHNCFVTTPCTCDSKCTKDNSNSECPLCSQGYSQCQYVSESNGCVCTSHCESEKVDANCDVCKSDRSKCQVVKNELGDDETDPAQGGVFFVGNSLSSYIGYIKEFGFSKVVVGKYVFARDYITLRSNADMWVLPEVFNHETYTGIVKTVDSDGSLLGNIRKYILDGAYKVMDALSPKSGSVYSMGELTLNKNASLMGTWDCYSTGQCLMQHDALVYFGHDFKNYASSLNINFDKKPLVGFGTYGAVYDTVTCKNKTAHPNGGYNIYMTHDKYDPDPSHPYVCDKCGAEINKATHKEFVTCPVTIYANHEVDIITSIDMRLTYIVACNGNVNIADAYSNSENDTSNLKQLPNAIASYNGDINYRALYSKICALFYAPLGQVDLDGWYQEIWGCCIGDTVRSNTYYSNFHRFTNWRTMDLQIAEAGNVYMTTKEEYDNAEDNVDDEFLYTHNTEDETRGGASLFFDKSILNAGTTTGTGVDSDNSALNS